MSPAEAARLLREERRWLDQSRERIRAAHRSAATRTPARGEDRGAEQDPRNREGER